MHIFSSDTNNVRVSFSLHLPSWHEYSKYNTCTSLACTICHIHFRYMYLPNTNTACVSIIFALCTILRRTLCQSIFRYMCHPLTNTVSSLIAICTTLWRIMSQSHFRYMYYPFKKLFHIFFRCMYYLFTNTVAFLFLLYVPSGREYCASLIFAICTIL